MFNDEIRFLVVNPDVEERRRIHAMLNVLGYIVVDEAHDGREALEMLRRTAYQCVISVTSMPYPDGFELLRGIKADEDLQSISVLMIIEAGRNADITLVSTLGAAGYIEKPVRSEILQKKLLFVLAKWASVETKAA